MSYRKITVDGKQYEYVIGKTHLKIKSFGLFKVSEVGNLVVGTANKFVVTPATISALVRKEPVPLVRHCKTHNVTTTELAADPFDAEIYQKSRHVINCPDCLENSYQNT